MSSTVNMDMALISTSNIIPQDQLKRVFEECVSELDGVIQNNCLIIKNENLGRLTINNRIVLSFSTDVESSKRMAYREIIRKAFTKKVELYHKNYLFELEQEKEKLERESIVKKELLESLKEVESKIEKSEIGFERQNQSECDALKGEIIDAAVAQGYEVVEETTSQGVQLQFIRRDY